MLESLQAFVPMEWRGAFAFLIAPIAWIPDWHLGLVNSAWYGATFTATLLKRVLLLLPILVIVAAVWATMLSIYTLPFRAGRGAFLTATLMSWWDIARSIWLFWAGLVRLSMVVIGWIWGTLGAGFRIVGQLIKGSFRSPLLLLDWISRSYFKPGVPWVAFLALLFWCAIEATIFMYTLSPTLSEVLAGITGFDPNPVLMAPILWLFLFFLVLGSFACIQVLTDAIKSGRIMEIIQMVFVEFFVMFFEVIFLYRELIDAITPWIAQTTNEQVQLGLVSTLLLACFGWIGVRGMTWFLFGRFGTPAVLAVLARDTIRREEEHAPVTPVAPQPEVWQGLVKALKTNTAWFKQEARETFELMSLPVLQLFAAAVNSIVVVISARPIFSIPFENLDDVLVSTPGFGNKKKKATTGGTRAVEPIPQGGVR